MSNVDLSDYRLAILVSKRTGECLVIEHGIPIGMLKSIDFHAADDGGISYTISKNIAYGKLAGGDDDDS